LASKLLTNSLVSKIALSHNLLFSLHSSSDDSQANQYDHLSAAFSISFLYHFIANRR
jgi:hypothetical protein